MASQPWRVLLIDDSPEDRYAFRRFLEHDQEQSFLCYEAASAAEGLAQCRERRPDAVLLDYHLPDDEGLALLATLIAEHGLHAFAMLLVTGQGSEQLAVAAMKLGAHDYLVKDLHLQHHLGRAVASAIERVRLQRALATSNAHLQHTEQALRIERDRFVTLVETVPCVVCAYRQRPDGTVSFPYASPRIAEIYGLSPEGLANDAGMVASLWHPDDVPRLLDTIELSRQHLTPWHEEFRVRNPARGERWIEGHSIPQREADGSTIWYGLLTDITERKHAEQASRESEERLRIVTEAAQVGMVIVDQQHRYRFANQAYATIFGLPSADIVGQRVADVLTPVYEAQIRPRLERALQGEPVHYELVLPPVTPDVHERFYTVQYEPSTYRSARVVIVTVVEISQHKRAEEQLHEQADLLDQVSDAIISVDTHFAIKSWNAAAEALYGWPAREVIGKSLHEILRTEYLDSDANQSLALLSAQGYWQGEVIQPHRDGTRLTILSSVRPVTNRAGKITGAVGINRDITERKRAEEQLRRSEARFRTHFELGVVGMAIASPRRYFQNVNDQLCTILGYTREELLQIQWSVLTHPDDLPGDIEQLQRVINGEIDSFSRDKRYIHKNGHVIYALVSIKAMRRADGTVETLLILIQDITQRKHAEQALARSAERLHIQASASRAFAEAGVDRQGLLDRVAQIVAENMRSACSVRLISEDAQSLDFAAIGHYDPAELPAMAESMESWQIRLDDNVPAAIVARSGQPLFVPVIDTDALRAALPPERQHIMDRFTPHSLIATPLQFDGRTIGSLMIARNARNAPAFDQEDFTLAQDLADRAGLAIANAQLLARVQDELAERTRAETALREREDNLRIVTETAGVGLALVDSEHRYRYANETYKKFLSLPGDDLASRRVADVLGPLYERMIHLRLERALRGENINEHLDMLGAAGDIRHYEARVRIGTYRGEPVAVVVLSDITERTRAETALREREEQLRLLTETMPAVPWSASPAGTVDYFTQRWLDLTGQTHEQALSSGWQHIAHPDDAPVVASAWQHSLASGMPYEVIHRIRTAGGSYRWQRSRALPQRDAHGAIVRWHGITDDIHNLRMAEEALRESEARFRQLAESLPQLIWTCGSDGLCDYLSPQWVAYTGIPAAEQLGLGWLAQLHPDEREEVADAWQAALDSGSDWAHEFRIRRHDGEYRWFDTRGVRLKDALGQTIKWFGSNTDIQEQREYQQTLNRYASQLQQLSHKLVEAQETERRRIAHELHDQIGQSLTGLKLSLDSTDTLPLAELSAQLGEARQVINELLGRVRTLSLDLRPSMLDDLGLLPALNWLIERYAAQTGVRVDWRHKGVERRFPTAIETSVYRIVQEALTNVARHAGVAVVELRLLADDERLLLQIADEGRGFNVEDARQSQQSVGLLGMHERVELVGGTIVVDSEPGQGTHVSIVFPLGSLEP